MPKRETWEEKDRRRRDVIWSFLGETYRKLFLPRADTTFFPSQVCTCPPHKPYSPAILFWLRHEITATSFLTNCVFIGRRESLVPLAQGMVFSLFERAGTKLPIRRRLRLQTRNRKLMYLPMHLDGNAGWTRKRKCFYILAATLRASPSTNALALVSLSFWRVDIRSARISRQDEHVSSKAFRNTENVFRERQSFLTLDRFLTTATPLCKTFPAFVRLESRSRMIWSWLYGNSISDQARFFLSQSPASRHRPLLRISPISSSLTGRDG